MTDLLLYVGSQGGTIAGLSGTRERENLTGHRCFTSAYKYRGAGGEYSDPSQVQCLLDSGAFSDSVRKRLGFEGSLERSLNWEKHFSQLMGFDWQAEAIASYDLLIDEKWSGDIRSKCRWEVGEAWQAVEVTVQAAEYLSSQREQLQPRQLVLGCQGVDAEQYLACVQAVLSVARPEDWIGLGGWCILGFPKFRHWLSEFQTMLVWCIPLIAAAGIKRVHLYGCLYEPALAPFAAVCHQYGILPSADSSRPILDCTKSSAIRAGIRQPYWRDNVAWWQNHCANISRSPYYQLPRVHSRQLEIGGLAA